MSDPEKFGKYEIVSRLGRGAMGVVYKGFDPLIERTVAIKTVRKDALDEEEAEDLLARFKREAQAAGRLIHPNIVTVYEYGEDNDTAFIAMEYVKGRELKEIIDNNERFSLDDIINIMVQLLDALDYSHSQGVVHRDIKPGNIIVLDNGMIKVTDFGIARIESSTLTQFGDVMGTPSYMSPEQFMGQTVDARSDIFSAGVILYHLLTGEKPFPGSSMATIMHRVMKIDPIKPSDLNFHVPAAMDFCTSKGLAKHPEQRFQNAAEFARALKNIDMEGRTITAPPPQPVNKEANDREDMVVMRGNDATVYEPAKPAPAGKNIRPPGRGKTIPLLIAAAVLLIAAATLWFVKLTPDGKKNSAKVIAQTAKKRITAVKKKIIRPQKAKISSTGRKKAASGVKRRTKSGNTGGIRISTGAKNSSTPGPLATPAARDITPPPVRRPPPPEVTAIAPAPAASPMPSPAAISAATTRTTATKKAKPTYPRLKDRGFGRMLSEDEW